MGAGLATVAHELRTPLSSVNANVRGLLRMVGTGICRSGEESWAPSMRWRASSSRCAI
jgi:two-component system CAI-1 autoinducer sensor kinase/phosphatase CqsS